MTTWQAMHALEKLGCQFVAVGDQVYASAVEDGAESSALLDIVRRDRTSALAYVQERQEGTMVIDDGCTYSLFDALAIGQAVRRGDAKLVGKVIFHQKDMTATVRWEPVRGDLTAYRERLQTALKQRLKALEDSDWENLTDEEYERFCRRYGWYTRLLEGEMIR